MLFLLMLERVDLRVQRVGEHIYRALPMYSALALEKVLHAVLEQLLRDILKTAHIREE